MQKLSPGSVGCKGCSEEEHLLKACSVVPQLKYSAQSSAAHCCPQKEAAHLVLGAKQGSCSLLGAEHHSLAVLVSPEAMYSSALRSCDGKPTPELPAEAYAGDVVRNNNACTTPILHLLS